MGTQVQKIEILQGDDAYPSALDLLSAPPKKLYFLGNPDILSAEKISIIGARKATPYGIATAEMAGRISAECEVCVVSGGAMGCDSAALRAAQRAGGTTLIVSGCGADLVYPHSSQDVFDKALDMGGGILSLSPWGVGPSRWSFVKRNAIIAALSKVLIVCEAGNKSGTMSTADTAADLEKIIYSIPGSIFSPTSSGTNRLIEEGARIIVDEQSLELSIALDYARSRMMYTYDSVALGPVMSALIASPSRPDDLAERLNFGVLDILKTLTDFEARGFVERMGDGRYSPTKKYLLEHNRKEKQM